MTHRPNPELEAQNEQLRKAHPTLFGLLSEKGKAIHFPKKGFLEQGREAQGKKINATIGMAIEDDGSPMRLPSLANIIRLDPCSVFPYAPCLGIPELRKTWQTLIYEKNPSLKGVISLPVVTSGLTHALNLFAYLFVNPGDPVVMTDTVWENYTFIFENAYGGETVPFQTFSKGRFGIDGLSARMTEISGKRIVLFNFPHNPTGYSLTGPEADEIVEQIRRVAEAGHPVIAVMDDAYFGLVYEKGVMGESLFARLAHLHENVLAVKIDGATKEEYAWGFRIGFITYACRSITPDVCSILEDKTGGAVRGSISSSSRIGQCLLLNAMKSQEYAREKQDKFTLLKTRFDRVKDTVTRNRERYAECFTPLPFNSGYFMCLEVKDGLNTEAIRHILLKEFNIGVIALGNLIRIAYSSVREDDIPALFESIFKACQMQRTGRSQPK